MRRDLIDTQQECFMFGFLWLGKDRHRMYSTLFEIAHNILTTNLFDIPTKNINEDRTVDLSDVGFELVCMCVGLARSCIWCSLLFLSSRVSLPSAFVLQYVFLRDSRARLPKAPGLARCCASLLHANSARHVSLERCLSFSLGRYGTDRQTVAPLVNS